MMNHNPFPRRSVFTLAGGTALALALIWAALSTPASVTQIRLQSPQPNTAVQGSAAEADPHGVAAWPLGVAP
jgi:hypothetical protein